MLRICSLTLALTAALTTAASACEVELTTGEMLHGHVLEVTDDQVIVDHPVLGELTVARENVTSINGAAPEAAPAHGDAPADDAETDAPPADEADDAPALAPEPEGFFAGWDSTLSLGFSGTQGDTRTTSANAQFRTLRETDAHRWIIEANYFYGKDSGETSQNEFRGELTKDWLLPDSPWFYFANALYQYDQFRPWRHRVGAYAGVGYEFIKEEDLELIGRLGLGGNYEFEGGGGFTPEALVGASLLRWHITENQNITGSATLYPNLEDTGEFRLNTGVEWTLALSEPDNMSVKLGLENQYESDPGDDAERNNLKYYGAVVFEF
ncbi:MAG: DUF481 domain-containing protein [Phycisphaeraceae bacterium]